jgi:murein DD-endopeptidase MepM/ murein hydrolase activator NlpD
MTASGKVTPPMRRNPAARGVRAVCGALVGAALVISSTIVGVVARPPPAAAAHAPLITPTTGVVVGIYGDCRDGCSRRHLGYDIENAIGVPIYAAAPGIVESVVRNRRCPSVDSTAGNQVAITHAGGHRTIYLHFDTIVVNNGQSVVKGQQLGTMGNVGSLACLEPPHLHFEVRVGNVALDMNDTFPRFTRLAAGLAIPRHFGLPSSAHTVIDNPSTALNANGRLGAATRATGGAIWYASQASPGSSGWTAWQSLGGAFVADPQIAQNQDGRLQIFALGLDYKVWSAVQTTPGGAWSGWSRLGVPPAAFRGTPAVARNTDGRLEVFVRELGRGAIYRIAQSTPNSATWSAWQTLGGGLTSDVAVTLHAGGGLEVFSRGLNGALWHIWQQTAGGNWSTWHTLGGQLNGAPSAAINADGRLEVVARGTTNAVYRIAQTGPGGGWSPWAALGGVLVSDPRIGQNLDGRLEVFGLGSDNGVYHAWQSAPGGPWTGWAALRGRLGSTTPVGANANGRLTVVARADGGLGTGAWHTSQVQPGSPTWTGWGRI